MRRGISEGTQGGMYGRNKQIKGERMPKLDIVYHQAKLPLAAMDHI